MTDKVTEYVNSTKNETEQLKLSNFWDNQDLFQDTRSKTYGMKKKYY